MMRSLRGRRNLHPWRGFPLELRENFTKVSLVIFAAAEAANQVSYAKRNRGSRVRALLYRCTKEVLGRAGAFVNNLDSIGGCLRRLSVCILRCSLQPLRPPLEPRPLRRLKLVRLPLQHDRQGFSHSP